MKADRATLGGVPGNGYVEFYSADGVLEESWGLFTYASEDEERVGKLFTQGRLQEFEGPIWEGKQSRRMRITVVMTGIQFGSGRVALRGWPSPTKGIRASGPSGSWRRPRHRVAR